MDAALQPRDDRMQGRVLIVRYPPEFNSSKTICREGGLDHLHQARFSFAGLPPEEDDLPLPLLYQRCPLSEHG